MNLETWYSSYSGLPYSFNDQNQIEKFIVDCMGIFKSVVTSGMGTDIAISFVDTPHVQIAACDPDTKRIFFSKKLFSADKDDRFNPSATLHETLAAIMGVTIHESSHFRWTTMDYEDAFALQGISKVNSMLYGVMNIVDDIYIDNQAMVLLPNLRWTIEARLDYFFYQDMIDERMFKIAEVDIIKTMDQLTDYMNAIVVLKNFTISPSRTAPALFDKLAELILTVKEMHTVTERAALAKQVYDLLTENIETEKSDDGDGTGGEDEDETSEPSGGDTTENSGSDGDADSDGDSSSDDGDDGQDDEPSDSGDDSPDVDLDSADMAADDGDPMDTETGSYEDPSFEQLDPELVSGIELGDDIVDLEYSETIDTDGWSEKRSDMTVEIEASHRVLTALKYSPGSAIRKTAAKAKDSPLADERYNNFSALLLAMSQRISMGGPQLKRGPNINQLYRIQTDSKIFNRPTQSKSIGPQEIIFLVDCSGSMSDRRIKESFAAVNGAVAGLEVSGHKTAVYGHTGETPLKDGTRPSLLIYKFKAFTEGATVLQERIAQFISLNGSLSLLSQNNDDIAIAYMKGKFTRINNQKTLIVISDGAPASSRLSGLKGSEQTRDEVDALRKEMNCKVLSISIAESAVRTNDFIYGEKNNFANDDAAVVTDIIKRMMSVE